MCSPFLIFIESQREHGYYVSVVRAFTEGKYCFFSLEFPVIVALIRWPAISSHPHERQFFVWRASFMTFPTTDQNNEETWLDQSEIKCGVGSQRTFSFFSALRAYFNNFGQKLLYFNVSRQKRVLFSCVCNKTLLVFLWLTIALYALYPGLDMTTRTLRLKVTLTLTMALI